MKFIVALAAVVSMCTAMGAESFTSDFTKPETAKMWVPDKSGGLNKTPKAAFNAAKKVYTIDNSASKLTVVMQNQKQTVDAKKGDVMVATIEACGTGKFNTIYECLSKNGGWLGMGASTTPVQLKKDFTKFKVEFTVKDVKKPTERIMFDLVISAGTNITIKSITLAKVKK